MSDFEAEFARRNALSHALAMSHCLQDHLPEMRATAETSLVRNLPSLRREDSEWIDRAQMRALLVAMDPMRPAITVAILNAVANVGDKRAIRQVEGLFGRIAQTDDPNEQLVRDAAYACLVSLREHAKRAKQSDLLLRGSNKPVAATKSILLRAAAKSGESPAAELLRADCAGRDDGASGKETNDDSSA